MKYKFCPVCAGKLKTGNTRNDESHPVCSQCGFVFYQNSKPTSSPVICNEANEVLLLKRAIEPYFGKWDMPGGFLENGEDPIDGLRREAKEEMNVEIEVGKIIAVFVDRYGDDSDAFYTLNLFYKCKIASGEIRLDKENSEYRWFSEEKVPWNDLAFRNTEFAIKSLYNIK